MESFSLTDVGSVRSSNQDYYFSSDTAVGELPNLYIVADGMGGHAAGEFASAYGTMGVIRQIEKRPDGTCEEILRKAVRTSNAMLFKEASADINKQGCGTTMVVATIRDGTLTVLNVGDSRLYLIDERSITKVTEDHSVVEEMVKKGLISREEALIHPHKHKITRAFGIEPTVEADVFEAEIRDGDFLLMCTDGLTNMVSEEDIYRTVMRLKEPKEITTELVRMANAAGGTDNITVTVIRAD